MLFRAVPTTGGFSSGLAGKVSYGKLNQSVKNSEV